AHRLGQPIAGRSQPTTDEGWELPTQHKDSHYSSLISFTDTDRPDCQVGRVAARLVGTPSDLPAVRVNRQFDRSCDLSPDSAGVRRNRVLHRDGKSFANRQQT